MHTHVKKALAAALMVSISIPAFAWGRQGHRLVALVAQDHLTPAAAANVKYLLGPDTMADVSSFGDDYRSEHPETAPWHFVDIPKDAAAYDRIRDCPAPSAATTVTGADWRDCAVDRIPYFAGRLQDPSVSKEDKAFALKMLIHIVGDLHQPFHAIGDARGGNQVNVTLFGSRQCGERYLCNLHGAWDEGLIEHHRLSETKYLAMLEDEISRLNLAAQPVGTPTAWANSSHRAAAAFWVDNGAVISDQYYKEVQPTHDRELELGGLHLADLLNKIFTQVPPAMTDHP